MFQSTFLILILVFTTVIFSKETLAQTGGGTYIVHLGGRAVAEETFVTEKLADGSIKTISRVATNTFTTTTRNKQPVEFLIESGGTQVLKTVFAGGAAQSVITGQPEKTIKTSTTVILENGVWSQFYDLLTQYENGKGGIQNLVGFLPSQTLEMPLTVEKTESGDFTLGGQPVSLSRFKITYSRLGVVVDILADQTSVPLLIDIPSQMVKVVRKGYEELLTAQNATAAAEANPQARTFDGEFTGEDVSFQNGENTLAGTLTLPKNDQKTFPAVVIITGSGGQDRDGAGSLFNFYKLIAECLSRAGVAVLRVDDRGVGKSTINPVKASETSYRDLISDSRSAVNYLTTRKEISPSKIALLGHSEGAETALTLAAEEPSRIAAIILLAASSRPVDLILAEQELYQRASRETTSVSDKTKILPLVQSLMNQFDQARLAENANNRRLAWFREHIASNPLEIARRVKCPVLIVQGERDALILAYHSIVLANALAGNGNQNVSLRILPNLTHIFTPISENTKEATEISASLFPVLQNWAAANLVK